MLVHRVWAIWACERNRRGHSRDLICSSTVSFYISSYMKEVQEVLMRLMGLPDPLDRVPQCWTCWTSWTRGRRQLTITKSVITWNKDRRGNGFSRAQESRNELHFFVHLYSSNSESERVANLALQVKLNSWALRTRRRLELGA